MNIDQAKQEASRVLREAEEPHAFQGKLSETDTRCKYIDKLLTEALGWHEHSIQREPATAPGGFVDYLLHTSRPAFVIEAKRNSQQFKLPSTNRTYQFKIGGVLSEDSNLRTAIDQCRQYGISKGTSFCCVTNGSQFIFFRSHNDLGIEFEDHQAIVFSSATDIISNFKLFYQLLSFPSVSDGSNITALPIVQPLDISSNFRALSASSLRTNYRTRNRLFPFIKDVVTEVFRDIANDDADKELLEQCYVEPAQHGSYEQSLRSLIRERPKLADGEILPLRVTRRNAGKFNAVLDKDTARGTKAEVVMLLGGIGAGKTTFIQRFRKVIAKSKIDSSCFWLNIDFNKYSDSPGNLEPWVSDIIFQEARKSYPELQFGAYTHLKQSYHLEYEKLKNGRLSPLYSRDKQAFEEKFSIELEAFEQKTTAHLIKLLRGIQQQHSKPVFLIFDNADQFSDTVQNNVFMLAHRIAQEVGCTLIVSLREESYWKNKDFGVLSAFHSMNFYVEPPNVMQVIARRFRYAADLLESRPNAVIQSSGLGVTPAEAKQVFNSLRETILNGGNFIDFLQDLSPGEVRRPLEQLARFLFSGHTNIDSILRGIRTKSKINIGFHEFLKSVALGERETFSEDKSDIVNLFTLEGTSDASNLNRLATLGYISSFSQEKSSAGVGYVPIGQVVDICAEGGIASDTCQKIIEFMNARRLLETEQQGREGVGKSGFVRTTRAFNYYLRNLGIQFSYVDLVLPGTQVPSGDNYYQMIERLSSQIYSTGSGSATRMDKLAMRIERAKKFATFMLQESQKHSMFTAKNKLDSAVHSYISGLMTSIERQETTIIENARKVFSRAKMI